MQFFSTITITALFAATMSMAIAIPAPVEAGLAIEKRTCGTLTGTALSVCQTACKAACSVGTLGLASKACKAACDLPAL